MLLSGDGFRGGDDARGAQSMQAQLAAAGQLVTERAARMLLAVRNDLFAFLQETDHPCVTEAAAAIAPGGTIGVEPFWISVPQREYDRIKEALSHIKVDGVPVSGAVFRPAATPDDKAPSTAEEGAELDAPPLETQPGVTVPTTAALAPALVQYSPTAQKGHTETGSETGSASPGKGKHKTFNLKELMNHAGSFSLPALERLLVHTAVNAVDVDTGVTLLEHAAQTGNIQLGKLCYRRGMSFNALTRSGDTAFNITVRKNHQHFMVFLHQYGVKVNMQDRRGITALHVATEKNDVDAICRLIEWGADVNLTDNLGRSPLHFGAAKGSMAAIELLLEFGADLNAVDNKNFTACGYAEQESYFDIMDRLVHLGGMHGQQLSELDVEPGTVEPPKFMRRSPDIGRLGKIPVPLVDSKTPVPLVVV